MKIKASFTVVGISAAVAASPISASVGTPSYLVANVDPQGIILSTAERPFVQPQTNLASESVFIGDGEVEGEGNFSSNLKKDFETFKTEGPEVTDTAPVFDIEPDFSDSVTVTDSQFTVTFSDKIDFDPSTPAVDFDPVSITEADAKEVTVADLADNDDVSISEAISNQPDIPKSETLTATDAAPLLHPQPAKSETLTATDAVDDFDIDKVLADSVSVTEAIENDVTLPSVADSVTAIQSNLKTFNSSVDFDPSDDDVDPDPITVSETISEFDFDKGLTDTVSVTESDAKEVTVAELADNDATSVTESIALDPESVLTDSLTAVEGIKLNPEIPVSDTASATESIVLDIRPPLSDSVSPTESIDTLLTLGDSEYVYPDYVNIQDGQTDFIFSPYSYTISSTEYFVPNTGVIGAAETINSVMLADQFVTTPSDSGGLVVNFHYTDVDEDDRALGGYYFNQTPLNPGNSTVGERTIL